MERIALFFIFHLNHIAIISRMQQVMASRNLSSLNTSQVKIKGSKTGGTTKVTPPNTMAVSQSLWDGGERIRCFFYSPSPQQEGARRGGTHGGPRSLAVALAYSRYATMYTGSQSRTLALRPWNLLYIY